jgi:hypothetical protein
MTIFGISLLENSLMGTIQGIFSEIRFISANTIDYFTDTNFFQYLSKLFSKNEIIENKEIIKKEEIIKKVSDNPQRRTSSERV